jgi:hypothetical protein
MARKVQTVAELMDEQEIQAEQTGAAEVIDAEMNKVEQMMNDVAGVTEGEIIYWLHRATEKNKALHGNFLKRYPKETPFIDIWEEARDLYKGGDFVLVAQKDGRLFKKASFTCERPIDVEKPKEEPKIDPFAALAVAMEKAMVVEKVNQVMNSNKEKPVEKGADPAMSMMVTIMQGMMAQNTALLQGMMQNRKEPAGGNSDLLEAIKLGSALAGGKLPVEEGEGGILDMLKPLIPAIPQILQLLTGKGPRPPVLNRPATPVPPRPVPPGAIPPAAPAVLEEAAGVPPPVSDPRAVVMARIVDEVKFVLTLPPSPKLYEHVIDYIDSYMPELLQQAEMTTPEIFASYVATLDPAFAGREEFFMNLHKQYMAGMEAPGEPAAPEETLPAS